MASVYLDSVIVRRCGSAEVFDIVGSTVGSTVGSAVVSTVGSAVGFAVGSVVGSTVGPGSGFDFGTIRVAGFLAVILRSCMAARCASDSSKYGKSC